MPKTDPTRPPASRILGLGRATCLVLALAATAVTAQDSDSTPPTDQDGDSALPIDQDNDSTLPIDQDQPTMAQVEQAWRNGDYVFVRRGLKHLAEETGATLAAYRYGRVLVEGRGGPRDIAEALRWLDAAAADNHVEAMTLLARLHLNAGILAGEGDDAEQLPLSEARATELLSRAAALGGAEAQYLLGQLYLTGTGVEANAETAFNWYLAAANQDQPEAQYIVSQAYGAGIGTEADADAAMTWLRKAAENGHLTGQFMLALKLENGDGVAKAPRNAMQWYRRAAENGLPIAQRSLGTHYLMGDIVEQNTPEGLRWLHSAAQAGDAGAMVNLGYAYATAMGVGQDDAAAAQWYEKASQYGLGRAMIALAGFYEAGRGVEQDIDAAIALYGKALETPDGEAAAVRLGRLAGAGALDGKLAPHRAVPWAQAAAASGDAGAEAWLEKQAASGVRPAIAALAEIYLADEDRAAEGVDMLQAAANAGAPQAQLRLGKMRMTGDHVPLDYVAAHKWFNIAATFGVTEAARMRSSVGDLMTPEQLAEAQRAARSWFETQEPQPPEPNQYVEPPEPDVRAQ